MKPFLGAIFLGAIICSFCRGDSAPPLTAESAVRQADQAWAKATRCQIDRADPRVLRSRRCHGVIVDGPNLRGPYLAVWQKQSSGQWKVIVDAAWVSAAGAGKPSGKDTQ